MQAAKSKPQLLSKIWAQSEWIHWNILIIIAGDGVFNIIVGGAVVIRVTGACARCIRSPPRRSHLCPNILSVEWIIIIILSQELQPRELVSLVLARILGWWWLGLIQRREVADLI